MNADDAVLLIGTLFLGAVVWRWQRAPDSFDLRKIIVDAGGDVSLAKIGQIVALLVSTWVLIHETRAGKMTEWLFTGYMLAWAGANLISKAIDKKADPAAVSVTRTTETVKATATGEPP
jgi:hypothetical protein